MLPNHAPLVIAEQFGTLAALYPGRIDLGIGRAPGTDQLTAHALRRTLAGDIDHFPSDVVELMGYFAPAQPGQRIQAVPGAGLEVPVWILGSSLYGAQLAALLGLPFAFASHFAPAALDQALEIYRAQFQPSETLHRPYVVAALGVVAAKSDGEARYLATSLQQSFVNLRSGAPGPLPPPRRDFFERLDPSAQAMLNQAFSCAVVGSELAVADGLRAFAHRTGADELMLTGSIYDHDLRLRSFEIAASVFS
jgi:luciferase family oxidoreductase group 1